MNDRLTSALYRAVAFARGRGHATRAVRRPATASQFSAHPDAFRPLIRALARDCDSVLDIGTGLMQSLELVPCRVKLGLDAHRPYLERRERHDAVPVNASALDVERLFVPGAVDLVTLIDVVEHFSPDDAREVLRQAASVARRRVILFTPRGDFPQDGFDAFGLGGEELQRHRSAWEPEDLMALGFRVGVLRGYHNDGNESFVEAFGSGAPPKDALLAWKEPH
jgi:hypothetical protein